MLVFEGADLLGKTTAARRCVELSRDVVKSPLMYAHMSRQHSEFYDELSVLRYCHWIRPWTVQDRFHLGALVWHKLKPSQEIVVDVVHSQVRAIGGMVVVFVSPDVKDYKHRLMENKRSEMFTPDKLVAANEKYASLTARYADVVYDHFPTDEELVELLSTYRNRTEAACS